MKEKLTLIKMKFQPGTRFDRASMDSRASWSAAMARMDQAAPDQAWDSIFNFLKIVSATDVELMAQVVSKRRP